MKDNAVEECAIAIRIATIADYDGVCALLDEIDHLHREALPGVFGERDPRERQDFVNSLVEDTSSDIVIAESQGTLIGLAAVVEKFPQADSGRKLIKFGDIAILIVTAHFRGRGVGRRLVERAEQWTREKGLSRCELGVWEFNAPALRFYEKIGFVTARRRMSKSLD